MDTLGGGGIPSGRYLKDFFSYFRYSISAFGDKSSCDYIPALLVSI
jgi:hypothetical protein